MLPQLAQDKANHALYGALIALVVFVLAQSTLIAACVVLAAACVKEIKDYFTPGSTMDPFDALATIGGGALVLATLLV